MIDPSAKIANVLPVSGIIPTRDRLPVLIRTLESVLAQSHLPAEIIIVDASLEDYSAEIRKINWGSVSLVYQKALRPGAASQRMQALDIAQFGTVWFLDDDIILEKDCTIRLWKGFESQPNVGVVNAMITNQRYLKPGFATNLMYRLLNGVKIDSYAGKMIGPAWNILPEDDERLPEYVQCEWLNAGCTMYLKGAMPDPVFSDFFVGYSMFEDATLSVMIGRTHTLLNARTARIFHDSQPGSHKNRTVTMARMELVNRHHVMTKVLYRTKFKFYLQLMLLEAFGILTSLRNVRAWKNLPSVIYGKISGLILIAGKS